MKKSNTADYFVCLWSLAGWPCLICFGLFKDWNYFPIIVVTHKGVVHTVHLNLFEFNNLSISLTDKGGRFDQG